MTEHTYESVREFLLEQYEGNWEREKVAGKLALWLEYLE